MLVRLGFGIAIALSILIPQAVKAGCAEEISRLMSKDTEKLTTRYNKIAKQAQQHASPRLVQEECRIARQLKPRLEDQIAALKQSGCSKDPQMGNMVADIMRGHEDDLAAANKTVTRSECR